MEYSFADFIESDELNRLERIVRDFSLYLQNNVGSFFYDRSKGSPLFQEENSENSYVNDSLLRYNLMTMIVDYNAATTTDLQVIALPEMIEIERKGGDLTIYIGLLPLQAPNLENLQLFQLNIKQ